MYQKEVSNVRISNYIPQYLWDVIICICHWYLFLSNKSSCVSVLGQHWSRQWFVLHVYQAFIQPTLTISRVLIGPLYTNFEQWNSTQNAKVVFLEGVFRYFLLAESSLTFFAAHEHYGYIRAMCTYFRNPFFRNTIEWCTVTDVKTQQKHIGFRVTQRP